MTEHHRSGADSEGIQGNERFNDRLNAFSHSTHLWLKWDQHDNEEPRQLIGLKIAVMQLSKGCGNL